MHSCQRPSSASLTQVHTVLSAINYRCSLYCCTAEPALEVPASGTEASAEGAVGSFSSVARDADDDAGVPAAAASRSFLHGFRRLSNCNPQRAVRASDDHGRCGPAHLKPVLKVPSGVHVCKVVSEAACLCLVTKYRCTHTQCRHAAADTHAAVHIHTEL